MRHHIHPSAHGHLTTWLLNEYGRNIILSSIDNKRSRPTWENILAGGVSFTQS